MNSRLILIGSVVLNAALATAIGFVIKRPADAAKPERVVREVTVSAPAPVTKSAQPTVQTNVESFVWSDLVTEDLKEYRDRLRAMGCPEKAVRLIITAEINQIFAERRHSVLGALQAQFWDLVADGPDVVERQGREAIDKIREDRRHMIAEILGEEQQDETEQQEREKRDLESRRRAYAWLPEEKVERMIALDKRVADANAEMWRVARLGPPYNPSAEAKDQQKTLEKQVDDERRQLLTAAEFEEYQLRNSGASWWASQSSGFEATEDEWRAVGKLTKQRDDALKELNSTKPENDAAKKLRDETIRQLNDELAAARREVLGPERSAEYDRGVSREYNQVRAVTQRYGLDDSVAVQVYDIQQIAMKKANELRQNTALDPDARAAALAEIRRETERTMTSVMGERVFATYSKNDDGWLRRLEQTRRRGP